MVSSTKITLKRQAIIDNIRRKIMRGDYTEIQENKARRVIRGLKNSLARVWNISAMRAQEKQKSYLNLD